MKSFALLKGLRRGEIVSGLLRAVWGPPPLPPPGARSSCQVETSFSHPWLEAGRNPRPAGGRPRIALPSTWVTVPVSQSSNWNALVHLKWEACRKPKLLPYCTHLHNADASSSDTRVKPYLFSLALFDRFPLPILKWLSASVDVFISTVHVTVLPISSPWLAFKIHVVLH